MDHLNYLCRVNIMLLRLFVAAVWSLAGDDLLALVCDVYCGFVTFCGVLGRVWCLIDTWSLPSFLLLLWS